MLKLNASHSFFRHATLRIPSAITPEIFKEFKRLSDVL